MTSGSRKAIPRLDTPVQASTAGTSWSPPAPRLPGPYQHLTLVSALGRAAGRIIWAACSNRRRNQMVVVDFVLNEEYSPSGDPERGRHVLDLRPWSREGWPAAAIVTPLPAHLPGRYSHIRLLKFVGLGGMGQVWMAEAVELAEVPVAIKFLTHPVYRRHPVLQEQCLQEARAGIHINSPCIARTYNLLDLREHQGEGWAPVALVMPLYHPTLQYVLDDLRKKQQRLPETVAGSIARNLLDALDALHSGHRLVHRDLKPANVLLKLPEDQPYQGPESLEGATALLGDLGMLCRIGERPLFALGQDGWKAPELFAPPGSNIADGDRAADPAEDLYSFGLVLAELARVTGPTEESSSRLLTRSVHFSTVEARSSSAPSWLEEAAAELTDPDPIARKTVRAGLRGRLLPRSLREELSRLASCRSPTGLAPHAASEALAVQLELEHYEILEEIGRGAFGLVYKARHRALQRVVAIKFLANTRDREEQGLGRFRTEAMAVARLNHPNFVQIHDLGEAGGYPYLVLEYCPGGSLVDRLRSGQPLDQTESVRVVETLARAMHAAHEAGVVHRDLKPHNVLLSAEGTLKITDFGLAKLLDAGGTQLTRTGVVMGTPAYMAPEQVEAIPTRISPRTDIYSLGVILYECLVGRAPFGNTGDLAERLHQVRHERPVPPRALRPSIDPTLEAICLRCLEKEPDARYPSAAALADDLDRFQHGKPTRVRSPNRLHRLRRWIRRRSRKYVALATILLLVTLAAGLLSRGLIQSSDPDGRKAEARNEAPAELALARAAASHGNWPDALRYYEQALEWISNPKQRTDILIERMPGLLAVHDLVQLRADLREVEQESESGLVALMKAELELAGGADRSVQSERLVPLLGQPGRFSASEIHYARALLTDQPRMHQELLQKTLQEAPFHHRARRSLLMLRVSWGEFEAASREAEVMRLLFPADPLPSFAAALASALEGDLRQMRQHLDRFGDRAGEKAGQAARAFVLAVTELAQALQPESSTIDPSLLTLWYRQLDQARQRSVEVMDGLGCGSPALAYLLDSLQAVADGLRELANLSVRPSSESIDRLIRAGQRFPEAALQCLTALARFQEAVEQERSGRLSESQRTWEQVIVLAQRGRTSPTVLPRFPLRVRALLCAALADVVLLQRPEGAPEARLERLRQTTDQLLHAGQSGRESRQISLDLLLQALLTPPSDAVRKLWIATDAESRLEERRQILLRLGQRLALGWQLEEPQEAQPSLWRARLANAAGHHADALDAARQARKLSRGSEAREHSEAEEKRALEGLKRSRSGSR